MSQSPFLQWLVYGTADGLTQFTLDRESWALSVPLEPTFEKLLEALSGKKS